MRENNTSATSNLGKEREQLNSIKITTGNSKIYKESCSIEKISEHKNTGLPTRTVEPGLGYLFLQI
ncbi:MAG: hypothetical protein QXE84_00310 [Candidatus Nitrosotenuis sp.]